MKRLTALSAAILVLSGCAQLQPKQFPEDSLTTEARTTEALQMSDAWNTPAVITEGAASMVLFTPYSLPESVSNRKITLELEPGATVTDLVAVLGRLGIAAIVADQDAASKEFYLPRYHGTLGGLLSAVTRATDVWFTWHDGTIVVSSTEKIGVTVPQEANFGDQLLKGLKDFGVKEAAVSWLAGIVTMDLTPSQFRKVRTYLERMTANAAVITMQVAIVGVTLKQDARQGIDWEKLQLSVLSGGDMDTLGKWTGGKGLTGDTSPTEVTDGSDGGTTSGGSTSSTSGLPRLAAIAFNGGALQGALFSQRFSFQGLFNYLQTYGNTETKQNVVLKTIAGNKVEFKSVTQTPYVAELSTTTTGTTTAATTGSTRTEKANDGITLELTPTYDAAANTVTVDMKLSLEAVVGFNELSAGNQIGTLTQPTTADRSFTDTLRMRPGQTVVVGGITYETVSNNRGAPPVFSGTSLESQSLKVDRQTMFIVVRPTVMRIGQTLLTEAGGLDLLPTAEAPVKR